MFRAGSTLFRLGGARNAGKALLLSLAMTCSPLWAEHQIIVVSEANTRPAGMDPLKVSIDKTDLALVPGAFSWDFSEGETYSFSLSNTSFHRFTLQLAYSGGQVSLKGITKDGCPPERVNATLTHNMPTYYGLKLTYSRDPSGCSISPAMGPPEARVKLRFQAVPQNAALYFQNPEVFSVSKLPTVLSLAYWKGVPVTIFFKSKGFLDCGKQITIQKQNDQFVVTEGTMTSTTSGQDDVSAPVISCKLSKIP